jgi:hypothetical protein
MVMVSPCFVKVQAAIDPNLRFGAPMCVPVVLLFGLSDGLKSSLYFQVAFWRAVGFERPPCDYLL